MELSPEQNQIITERIAELEHLRVQLIEQTTRELIGLDARIDELKRLQTTTN